MVVKRFNNFFFNNVFYNLCVHHIPCIRVYFPCDFGNNHVIVAMKIRPVAKPEYPVIFFIVPGGIMKTVGGVKSLPSVYAGFHKLGIRSQKKSLSQSLSLSIVVRMVGLEPTSLATHASETCVSTNFTTSAKNRGAKIWKKGGK